MFSRISPVDNTNTEATMVDLALKKNKSDVSDEQLFDEAVRNLRQAILSQGKSHRRVASRVRFLIRSIMFGLVSSLFFILFLIYLLSHQVEVLTASLDSISTKTSHLLGSIDGIEGNIVHFETSMEVMPNISNAIIEMNKNVSSLTTNVGVVTENIKTVRNELQQLNISLSNLSNNTQILEQSVGKINNDMNAVTKPMKRFNDFNPFN